jgi:hypothetical protein
VIAPHPSQSDDVRLTVEGQPDTTPDAPEPSPDDQAQTTPVPRSSAGRRIGVRVILVIATLLTVVAIFAIWANRQVLDADHWANTSTKLLQNNSVRTEVSNYLVDQIYANVDVAGTLSSALPPRLRPLAGPVAGGLENLAQRAAFELLGRPFVQEAWRQAQRVTAQEFINIVENKSKLVTLSGNAVFIDLRPILGDLGQRLGLPASLVDKLPPDAGRLRVLSSNQISTVQNGVKLLRGLAIVLPLVAVLLYALAVYLYTGRRRHTLVVIAVDLVAAGLLVIVARNIAGDQIVNSLVKVDSARPAAQATWSISTEMLSEIAQSVILGGLAVLAAAALAGPRRPAVAMRRVIAPWLRDRRILCYAIVLAGMLLLVWWGPIPALRMPIPVLVIILLLWLGVEALRRQTLKEFPDAQSSHAFSGLSDQLDRFNAWRHRHRRSEPPPSAPTLDGEPSALSGREGDRLARLERLVALRDSGALTEAEFTHEKQALIGGRAGAP